MEPRVTPGEQGFTLIELMVVVAIVALLTVSATLGVNRPRTAHSEDWTRFADIHARLREQAVMGEQVLGLRITGQGYDRVRRTEGGWQAQGATAAWRGRVQVVAPADAREVVAFLPSGESTPVRLRFANPDGSDVRRCGSDGWGPVTCELQ